MNQTGQVLKQAREQKNLSLNEVSLATKINPKILAAIEENDENRLPAKTFLRGFVRTYASYLKMDVNQVMDIFHEEHGTTQPRPTPAELSAQKSSGVSVSETQESAPSVLSSKKLQKGLIAGALLLLVVLIISIKSTLDEYEKEKQVSPVTENIEALPNKPSEGEKQEQVGPVEKPVEAKTEETTTTEQAKAPKAEEPAAAPKPQANPVAEAKKTEAPAAAPAAAPAPAVAATTEPPKTLPEKETEKPPAVPSRPQEVIIEAFDAVKIDYRVDGGNLRSQNLQPDQVITIKAKSQVNVDVADGGVISVILNGKDLGVPGSLGQPMKLRFPQTSE